MSTNSQRLVSAIRRLAKTDPDISAAISASSNRGDQAGEGATAKSGGDESRICCDGSTSSNPNPGTTERDPDSGGQDASGGLDASDPAKLTMSEGSLTGLTDCATGEPICFAGDGFVPPDGWDDPQSPPSLEDWEADPGVFWETTSRLTSYDPIDTRTKGQAKVALEGQITGEYYIEEVRDNGGCVELWVQATSGSTGGSRNTVCEMVCADGDGTQASRDLYCGTNYGDPAEEEIPDQIWPEDGCVNLAIVDGTIVGSKYDPENDGTYSKPMSEIQLCDGSGNQISLSPSADGGWKTIDAINGGDGYLYDSSGTQIARISADEYSDPNV